MSSPVLRTMVFSGMQAAVLGTNGLLTARWLGASERGVVVLAWSISSALLLVGGVGLVNAARVVVPSPEYRTDFYAFLAAALRIVLWLSLPVGLMGAMLLWLLADVRDPLVIISFGLMCTLMVFGAIVREALHGSGRHVQAVSTDLGSAVIQLAGATALYEAGALDAGRMIMLGLGGAAAQIALGFILGPQRAINQTQGNIKGRALLILSLPGIGITLGQWIAWRSDRLILGIVGDVREVGVYGAVSTMADLPWLIPSAAASVLTTRFAVTRDHSMLKRWRRKTVVGTLLASASISCAALWVLLVFLGGDFRSGVPALFILIPAGSFLASSQIDLVGCLVEGGLSASSRVCLAGAVSLVVTAFPLAYLWGPTGCATASLISYATMAVGARASLVRYRDEARRQAVMDAST